LPEASKFCSWASENTSPLAQWASGIRFCLNIDVRKDKIVFGKDRLSLYSKISTAANAHLVESLLADLSE